LSVDNLDAHYSRVLGEARESISRSAALTDDERRVVAAKLGSLKEIVDRGAIGALIDSLAINGGGPAPGYDDSVAAVSIVDDREYAERESRRRDVFAAEWAADAAATITDYEGHADPAMLAPPVPPEVPAAAPGPGPSIQYPVAAPVGVGEPLGGFDASDSGEAKPLPGYGRVPWELAQKMWARFRALPIQVQIVAGVLVAVLVVVGLFGRGSTATEATAGTAGRAVIVNPNGNQPSVDRDFVELQPTGGVGSNCDTKGFEAARAFGKNKGDGWVCLRAHGIDGEFMEIDFGHKVTVGSVEFMPGLWLEHAGGTNEWNLHRLLTQVKILVPEGQPQPDPIKIAAPTAAPKKQVFAKPFTATRISLIVQATRRPENSTQTVATPDDNDDIDKTFALSALKFVGRDDARR
jgi:hypothetical protein